MNMLDEIERFWIVPRPEENVIIRSFFGGDPVAHQRPVMTRSGRVFTPKKTADYKDDLAAFIRTLKIKPTKSDKWELYGVQLIYRRSNRQRVDIDNLCKTTLDAMTRAQIWHDDSQVRELFSVLKTGEAKPGVGFVVYLIGSDFEKNAAKYGQLKSRCDFCGGLIDPKKTFPSSVRRFCSRECHLKSNKVSLKCGNCGGLFQITRSCLRQKDPAHPGKFYQRQSCSRECSIELNRKKIRIKGKESDKWVCTNCNGRVSRKEYKICRACSMLKRGDPSSNYWKLRHKRSIVAEKQYGDPRIELDITDLTGSKV